jgi:hypothetical protein
MTTLDDLAGSGMTTAGALAGRLRVPKTMDEIIC